MKWLKRLIAGLLVLLLVLALLVWFLPASWASEWVARRLPGMQLQDVHGTLWNARADHVTGPNGQPLGTLRWTLSRRALIGHVVMDVHLNGPWLTLDGDLDRQGHRAIWRQVRVHALLEHMPLPASGTLGAPRGVLDAQVDRAVMIDSWPSELQAQLHWRDAAMQTAAGPVALGNLSVQLHGLNGVIDGVLKDDGKGPLMARGSLQLSPLGWRLQANLQPRGADPALRQWLALLGPPDASGGVRLERRAGLAAALPDPIVAAGASP